MAALQPRYATGLTRSGACFREPDSEEEDEGTCDGCGRQHCDACYAWCRQGGANGTNPVRPGPVPACPYGCNEART